MKDSNRIAISLITDMFDNVLMGFREKEQLFCCPAGHIHEGEDSYEGMQRELFEETGLDCVDIKLVKVEYNKDKKLMLYLFKITVDPTQAIDFSKDPDKEFSKVEYVDPNNVVEKLHVPVEDNIALQYWINN